ncbi:unnamed protein product [Bemisia tabaci]|uniref:Uncharacterized protein n=1 Tax=Bemisia tabaci TaxID=7038 RepID=A0A9P0F681_BEMTA|nr:unnamed protein product [Bemisia tabaci]
MSTYAELTTLTDLETSVFHSSTVPTLSTQQGQTGSTLFPSEVGSTIKFDGTDSPQTTAETEADHTAEPTTTRVLPTTTLVEGSKDEADTTNAKSLIPEMRLTTPSPNSKSTEGTTFDTPTSYETTDAGSTSTLSNKDGTMSTVAELTTVTDLETTVFISSTVPTLSTEQGPTLSTSFPSEVGSTIKFDSADGSESTTEFTTQTAKTTTGFVTEPTSTSAFVTSTSPQGSRDNIGITDEESSTVEIEQSTPTSTASFAEGTTFETSPPSGITIPEGGSTSRDGEGLGSTFSELTTTMAHPPSTVATLFTEEGSTRSPSFPSEGGSTIKFDSTESSESNTEFTTGTEPTATDYVTEQTSTLTFATSTSVEGHRII